MCYRESSHRDCQCSWLCRPSIDAAFRVESALPAVLSLVAAAWSCVDCSTSNAQALTWDPSGTLTGGSMGGGGNWNDAISQWYNSQRRYDLESRCQRLVRRRHPGGTVTLTATNGETVGNMVFATSGYSAQRQHADHRHPLTSSAGTVTANQNATINSSIADNGGGVTFTGSHVLTLGAAFDTGLTGPITVSSGTLLVNGTNPVCRRASTTPARSISTAARPLWRTRTTRSSATRPKARRLHQSRSPAHESLRH